MKLKQKEYVHKRGQKLLGKEEKQKSDDPFHLIVKEDSPQQKDSLEIN